MNNYTTAYLESERLIIKKGDSASCKKVYEYDLTKCTGIDQQNELVKFDKQIDFIGQDSESYYEDCQKEKMFDWYIYLKENNFPIGNIIADREIEDFPIEISYNMHPDFWNKGYITEALREVVDYLKLIGYKKIIIHFYEGNEKSKKVCEKLGFKYYKKTNKLYKPTDKMIDEYEYILYL